jgi:hypothetical protein
MTPSIAVIRIGTLERRGFPLWIPLFLLWIPAILLSPLILVVVFGVCMAGKINPWRAMRTFWSILCSLPGTNVHVCADGKRILVRIL